MGARSSYKRRHNRGRGHGQRWRGATLTAVRQLKTRAGATIDGDAWATIVRHARAGDYQRILEYRDHPSGTSQTYAVPMGTCAADMVIVPMVIDVDAGVVITVLDPA